MKKSELANNLKKFFQNEDEIISSLKNFLLSILKTSSIDDSIKKEIEKHFAILSSDTETHINSLKELDNYIKESSKDEF